MNMLTEPENSQNTTERKEFHRIQWRNIINQNTRKQEGKCDGDAI